MRWRIRTVGTVLVVPPLLHLLPLHRLAPRLGRGRRYPSDPVLTERIVGWVDRLLWRLPWPWRFTCLKRAAVLYALLRRTGIDIELWIGVRRDETRSLAAHAWLVHNGSPFLETGAEHIPSFQVIARFPEAGAAVR